MPQHTQRHRASDLTGSLSKDLYPVTTDLLEGKLVPSHERPTHAQLMDAPLRHCPHWDDLKIFGFESGTVQSAAMVPDADPLSRSHTHALKYAFAHTHLYRNIYDVSGNARRTGPADHTRY
jgi:hypothetical protein